MTTRTVVCSECGAEASGRYACGECGALLAAVVATARAWGGDDQPAASAPDPVDAAPPPEPDPQAVSSADWFEPTDDALPDLDQPDEPGRVPAGSYLAPSAILPPLGARPIAAAATPADAHALPTINADASTRPPLAAALDRLDLTADAPRRALAAGAALAAVGFLLPWAQVLAGAGLLGDYFTQWGVAGPGHWIVVALLVGLAGAALAGDRLASLPVGVAGIAAGALLVGLVWPYLFGVLGRSIGVWTVLAGAIVLVVGGALETRSRHAPGGPAVQ